MPNAGTSVGYTYDGMDRLTGKTVSFPSHSISEQYSYYGYTSGGVQHTTPQISGLTLKKDNTATASYSYTYDALDNILTVSENGVLKLSYQYDELNQLTRENNAYANKTWTFSYDNAGNIISRKEYSYTTGTLSGTYQSVSYTYSTGAWKDLLTNYGGTTISYDTIGNPLSWRNLSAITWEGR